MKHSALVFIGLVLLCFLVQPAFCEDSKESFYSQINRAVIRLEHFEAIVQEGSSKVITKNAPDGTAFFVVSGDQLFVVSARHVVVSLRDVHKKLNNLTDTH